MISRIIKKTVDLSKIQKVDQLEGPLYQLENGGHTFEITCLMDGAAASVSGTVSARFLRADEETVYFTGTLTGNVVSITLPQSCYVSNGRFGLVVFVSGNDITSAVYAVAGSVYRSTSDHIIDPTEEIPSLEDLIAKIGECEEATADAEAAASTANAAAAAAVGNFAPNYANLTFPVEVGTHCTHGGNYYVAKTQIDSSEAWTAAHWTQVTAGAEIGDLKSATQEIDGVLSVPFVWKNGYYAIATGYFAAQSGTVTYHSTEKFSGNTLPTLLNTYLFTSDSFIMVWNGNTYQGYLMDGVWKKNTTVLDSAPEFDNWAVTLHNVTAYEDVRLVKNETQEQIIEDLQNLATYTDNRFSAIMPKRYMKDHPSVPLFPEMCADFCWCSVRQAPVLYNKNAEFTVSGSANSTVLTVSAVSDGVTMADLSSYTGWIGGVLTTDGISYKVYNFKYNTSDTLEIYPALDTNVTNATLGNMIYDATDTYQGMHLTSHGYKAYMYALYHTNPKHCETSKYIATFNAYDTNVSTSPFTKYGGQSLLEFATANRNIYYLQRYTKREFNFTFAPSYTPSQTKSGVYWEVNLKNQSGYVELYVNAISTLLNLPEGQEIYVDVTIDGDVVSHTTITDAICHRVVADYVNASTGRIDIYVNKLAPIDGGSAGFSISRCTWWINTLTYDGLIIPKNATIAQEFDSWGVFHDAISATTLSALQDAASGVSVPYENHSLGSQTSAWGKAWFYENVLQYRPAICITDFVINDQNSVTSGFTPTVIEGPDGKEYDNIVDVADYCENYRSIIDSAIYNGIQPIVMRGCIAGYTSSIDYTLALIDSQAQQFS